MCRLMVMMLGFFVLTLQLHLLPSILPGLHSKFSILGLSQIACPKLQITSSHFKSLKKDVMTMLSVSILGRHFLFVFRAATFNCHNGPRKPLFHYLVKWFFEYISLDQCVWDVKFFASSPASSLFT